MAIHTQTGRACKEQCIPNYQALIDDKEIERITILNEKRIEEWNGQYTSQSIREDDQ